MVLASKSLPRCVFSPGLLVVLLVLLGAIGSGCALTPPLLSPTPFDLIAERQKQAEQSVLVAVTALDGKGSGGDRKAADAAIRDAVRFLGEGSDAYLFVGQQLIERGHPAEAVRLLSEATKNTENVQNAALWATLATAYEKAGDTAGAARAKKQADQQAESVMATIGKTPRSEGVNDLATAETVERFLETGTYYSEVKNDTPHAVQALREAYRIAPEDPLVLNALGYILADKGTSKAEWDEAVRLTHEAVDSDLLPPSGVILDSYGWALFKTGDLPGARRVLRKAVDLEPNIAECRYHLGVVYGQMGLIDEARLELDRATTIRKNYAEAEQAKKQLKQPPGKGVTEGA